MAPITKYLAVLTLAISVSARTHSLRSAQKNLVERTPAPVPELEALVEGVDVEKRDQENGDDFIEARDIADELNALLEARQSEDVSLEKRSDFARARTPSNLKGTKSGIGSWFRANSWQDSTNGKSWCGIHYNNNMMGFAVNFDLLSRDHATWGTDPKGWIAAGKKYCGLEAEVTYKGRKTKMYIMDAFDPRWVRTTYSIDILQGAWAKLFGRWTDNKNVVMMGVKWKLTGRRNKKYSFAG